MTDAIARAEYYLDLWAKWQHASSNSLGFPKKVPMLMCSGSHWDSEDQMDRLDHAAAEAAEAVIDGLPHLYRLAIHNAYHVSVIRFNRRVEADLLHQGKISFTAGMMVRGFV